MLLDYFGLILFLLTVQTKFSNALITDENNFDGRISALSNGHNVKNDVDNINTKKIIRKCCPMNEYVWQRKQCKYYNERLNMSNIDIYDENFEQTKKLVENIFTVVPGKFSDNQFKNQSKCSILVQDGHLYLTESGVLYLEIPNAYHRWFSYESDKFCVDYQLTQKFPPVLRLWIALEEEERPSSNIYVTSGILVSCVFLLLVLIVYIALPELQNLGGMILMAYVSSLFAAFFQLAIVQVTDHVEHICIRLTYSIYFLFLATFCWMSVMSYDIWWTFRGYAKARPIHRRGENFKFTMYCLYAWGLPLAMTIAFKVINESDLTHVPWFITPNVPKMGCFLEGGQKLVYLYIPMLILIVSNWIFYLMTAFNVWRLSRGTSVLNTPAAGSPAGHRSQWHRFLVYLKLSIVMGLNWVLEVASFAFPGLRVWYLSDAYNILMGIAIFLIFVCKAKIFRKLKKQLLVQKSWHWSPRSKSSISSTSDSTSSQETQTLQVCFNPKGPSCQMKSF